MKSPTVASPSTIASAPRMASIVVSRARAKLSAVAMLFRGYYTGPRVGAAHDVVYNWAFSTHLHALSSREERMPRGVVQCVAIVLLVVIATTGCSTIQDNPKTAIGGVGGAAFGGL